MTTDGTFEKLARSDLARVRRTNTLLSPVATGLVTLTHVDGVYTVLFAGRQATEAATLASGAPRVVVPVLAKLYAAEVA